jgi:hypothetical protein
LAAAGKLAADSSRRLQGAAGKIPVHQSLHGHLRALRRLCRQVPLFIGTGDPKNMPVLRAELLRSVYRNDFTSWGKLLGR